MSLTAWAEAYCERNRIRHRQPVYAARRFEDLMGELTVENLTTELMNVYRSQATAQGLTANTIESGLKYLVRLVFVATGKRISRGDFPPVAAAKNSRERTERSELTTAAVKYCEQQDLATTNVVSNCNRFQRIMGTIPVADIGETHFAEFEQQANATTLTKDTIRKTLISVKSVCSFVTGKRFHAEQVKIRKANEPALVQLAESYAAENRLNRQAIVSNAKRFCRELGDIDPKDIKTEQLIEFRKRMMDSDLSAVTIEKTITDVTTLVRHVTHTLLWPGKRLRRRRPTPKPVPMEHLEKLFEVSPLWLRQWMVLTFFTAGRLADSMRLQLAIIAGTIEMSEHLVYQASKTGRDHTYPIPGWLRGWLKPVELPFRIVNAHSCRVVRHHIVLLSDYAGSPSFTPKQLRQRGIVQWMRANGAAGAIVHGKSLGVCDHYVPAIEILEEAAPKVVVPAAFKSNDLMGLREPADTSLDVNFTELFGKLDLQSQQLVISTMKMFHSRLA